MNRSAKKLAHKVSIEVIVSLIASGVIAALAFGGYKAWGIWADDTAEPNNRSSQTMKANSSQVAVHRVLSDGTVTFSLHSDYRPAAKLVPTTRTISGSKQDHGLKVFAIRKGSLFDVIGLQNGDVITAIDQRGPSMGFGYKVWSSLLEAETPVRLEFERSGEARSVRVVNVRAYMDKMLVGQNSLLSAKPSASR